MESLERHAADPRFDEISGDAIVGRAGGSCGDLAQVLLDVDADGLVRGVGGRVRGRQTTLGALSFLAGRVRGRPLAQAAQAAVAQAEDFAQLDHRERERAMVAEDAIHHALGNALLSRARDVSPVAGAGGRLVAMSGGVDSAVALHDAIADEDDGAVVGATLRLWIDPHAPDPDRACCAPDSVRRARATCHAAGVGHFSLDLSEAFARRIVEPFVALYGAGLTPNPCVSCNGGFRLEELVRAADALGLGTVVTGHYVRTGTRDGRQLVRAGTDRGRDQSYMLATLPPEITARFEFPLGSREKTETRARAAELGLEQATIADSQEVCFLGGGDYRAFLDRRGALGRAGAIVGPDGSELGRHDGLARFTPGQRRGIGVQADGGSEPLYVTDVDRASGTVHVGPAALLSRTTIEVRDVRWHVPPVDQAFARFRYRSADVPVDIEPAGDGALSLHAREPVRAPAPGQTACLYDVDQHVLAAGTIVASRQ